MLTLITTAVKFMSKWSLLAWLNLLPPNKLAGFWFLPLLREKQQSGKRIADQAICWTIFVPEVGNDTYLLLTSHR